MSEMPRPEDLISHRGRAVLLTRIEHCDDDVLIATALPGKACDFADGDVPAWVGLEYICQAAAAFEGFQRWRRGDKIIPGLFLGTQRYSAQRAWFAAGVAIHIQVQPVMRNSSDIGVYAGTITDCHGGLLADAVLKAYMPADVDSFLTARSPP